MKENAKGLDGPKQQLHPRVNVRVVGIGRAVVPLLIAAAPAAAAAPAPPRPPHQPLANAHLLLQLRQRALLVGLRPQQLGALLGR